MTDALRTKKVCNNCGGDHLDVVGDSYEDCMYKCLECNTYSRHADEMVVSCRCGATDNLTCFNRENYCQECLANAKVEHEAYVLENLCNKCQKCGWEFDLTDTSCPKCGSQKYFLYDPLE